MAGISLFDLVTLQRNDVITGLVEDVTTYAPEFSQFPVTRRPGTYYEIASRTALPASQFRAVNNGVTASKSAFKKTLKEMFFIDTIINVDEAIYKGDDRSTGDILSHESQGALQSTIITVGSQIWYGTANSQYGFGGIRSQLSGSVQAGGTTNSTSAYLLWFNEWGVGLDVGNDGEIAMPPFMRQQISATDVGPSTGSGKLFAWVSNISCWIGLSVKSAYSVWAITGITQSSSTQYWTDTLSQQLLALIPLNRRNGLVWWANRLALSTLQRSRTVTLFGQGTGPLPNQATIAATPTDCAGFSIVVTDSITNTESN
jgi:hypothetical protein